MQGFTTPICRAGIDSVDKCEALLEVLHTINTAQRRPDGRPIQLIVLLETCNLALLQSLVPVIMQHTDTVVAVELGNEIDLTDTHPEVFANFLESGYHTLRNAGYKGDIITGGISSLRPDKLAWLADVMNRFVGVFPHDMMIGIHRYGDAATGQNGYVSRSEETAAIQKLANGSDIAITEFGYPVLDGESDDIAVASIPIDLQWWKLAGCPYVCWYQWTDGPTNTNIDRFGLVKSNGDFRNTLAVVSKGA